MTEPLLQNRQRVAPSRRPSDIRLLTKDRQLQSSHRGIYCDIYLIILSSPQRMAWISNGPWSWKLPLLMPRIEPSFYYFYSLTGLMRRPILKLQGSYSRKQIIPPLPSQFFEYLCCFNHIVEPLSSSGFISRAWKPTLLWKERFLFCGVGHTAWWHARILCKHTVGICKSDIFTAIRRWPRGSGISGSLNVKREEDKLNACIF